MKIIETPSNYNLDSWNTTAEAVFIWAKKQPDLVIIERFSGGSWLPVTAGELAREVEKIAAGLIASGIQRGDRVVIVSSTRYEWPLLDYAIWAVGGVTVSVYESSSAEQIRWILEDSEAVFAIVETETHVKRIAELQGNLYKVERVLAIDPVDGNKPALEQLAEDGRSVPIEAVHERIAAATIEDDATLIYTSGTTGRPKGVRLQHRHFLAEALGIINSSFNAEFKPGSRTLFFLPLAHVFGRAVSIAALIAGSTVGHFGDPNKVPQQFPIFKPTYIITVPRIFEKLFKAAETKAYQASKLKGKIFTRAADIAVAHSIATNKGKVSPVLKAQYRFYDKLVYSKIREALGGQCKFAISGGAALSVRLSHFYRGVGVAIYEGYGLTETTAAITVSTPDGFKAGKVGRPLAGNAIRIADDGEVLMKGDVVFRGYWRNDEATKASIIDGWFHSGDLGKLDSEGYLSITGRKKEIIVTAGGKNVAPGPLEDMLKTSPLVSHAVVTGEAKPFVGALIALDPAGFAIWKKGRGKPESASIADLRDDADLNKEIQKIVDKANGLVSHAEAIKKFRILEDDFTVDSGELTQSLKVRRLEVLKKRQADFDWLYGPPRES